MFPDVVILAGGFGKRLASVTGGGQKVLVDVGGKPFLEILVDYIAAQGGQRFILCTGHGGDAVEKHFATKKNVEIVISPEQEPLGTGGAIKQGSKHVKTGTFLAMNGDCFCVIDYKALIAAHQARKAKATIAVTLMPDARDYGTIEIDAEKHINAFKEKIPIARPALINTGTYCLDRKVFDLVETSNKFSIENDFFPKLVGQGFYSFEVENKFIDIGTPDRYGWAQEHLKGLLK